MSTAAPESDLDLARPLLSDYLSDGVHQDRFSLTGIELAPGQVHGELRLDGYGVSPEDVGGFHLTAPTVFRMAGQLVVIHTHWLAGRREKTFEVWVRDHHMRHQRPVRDPERIPLTMSLTAGRVAARNPGMLRVEYEANVGEGAVVGRTVSYVDLSGRPEAMAHARDLLTPTGLWIS